MSSDLVAVMVFAAVSSATLSGCLGDVSPSEGHEPERDLPYEYVVSSEGHNTLILEFAAVGERIDSFIEENSHAGYTSTPAWFRALIKTTRVSDDVMYAASVLVSTDSVCRSEAEAAPDCPPIPVRRELVGGGFRGGIGNERQLVVAAIPGADMGAVELLFSTDRLLPEPAVWRGTTRVEWLRPEPGNTPELARTNLTLDLPNPALVYVHRVGGVTLAAFTLTYAGGTREFTDAVHTYRDSRTGEVGGHPLIVIPAGTLVVTAEGVLTREKPWGHYIAIIDDPPFVFSGP